MPSKPLKRNGMQWDQIKSGYWIVVLRDFNLDNDEEEDDDEPQMVWGMFGPQPATERKPYSYDGVPWKILEMSYPFLCVTDGKIRCSIDFRRFDLQVVTQKYAEAVHSSTAHDFKVAVASPKERKRLQASQQEEEKQTCKRCGTKMFSQKLLKPGSGEWAYFCPVCDGIGGPVTRKR